MRSAQGCRNRSDLDAQCCGDRAVVEVRVVTKEDREALPLRQRGDPRADRAFVIRQTAVRRADGMVRESLRKLGPRCGPG